MGNGTAALAVAVAAAGGFLAGSYAQSLLTRRFEATIVGQIALIDALTDTYETTHDALVQCARLLAAYEYGSGEEPITAVIKGTPLDPLDDRSDVRLFRRRQREAKAAIEALLGAAGVA